MSDCLGGLYGSSPCQSIPHYQYSWCGLKSEESEFNHGLILPGGVTWNYGDKGFQVDAMMSRKWCLMGSHGMRWRSSRCSYGSVLAQIGPAGNEICSKHLLALETSKEPAYHPHPTTFERIAFGDPGSLGSSEVISEARRNDSRYVLSISLPSLRHSLTLVALAKQACFFSPQPIRCQIGPYLYFSGSLACLVHPAMSKTRHQTFHWVSLKLGYWPVGGYIPILIFWGN